MDLNFTDAENAFRDEVRSFISQALPEDIARRYREGREIDKEAMVRWTRILNAKGWSVPHWPVEHGGTGWSEIERYIFQDELQQAPAPQMLPFGHDMVGPVIYTFGDASQKAYFLPRIANLDDWWCQGFSESGAGSDLASLKTTARLDHDHYIVNGQKIWTTLAQHADWIFCLVRTDPGVKKQTGITFLLIDMKSPGITVRPIQLIDGGHEVNEIVFDEVIVPVENRVGEENKGWDYAKFLLGHERIGIARIGASKARLRRIKEIARTQIDGARPLSENRRFREKCAAVEIELKALEMTQLRVLSAAHRREHGKPDPASSILKVKGSELQQATTELLLEAIGPYALRFDADQGLNAPSDDDADLSPVAPIYFNHRKVSIYGGSNEIQRNIIAKAILGF